MWKRISPESWPARWISGGYTPKKKLRYPADSFKKEFEARDVKSARLYITACGLYEARLNGIDRYMNVMDGSAGWSDAGILIPYRIYKRYGDADILKDNYASMHRYTEYKIKTLGIRYITGRPTGIERRYRKYIFNYGKSYGEWAEPADVNAMRISDFVSPHPEETTAYIVYILECMAEIAALLGEDDDAGRYGELAGKVRAGYQALSRTAILRGRKAVNTPSAGPAAEHKPVVILTLCLKRGFIPLLKGLYCY